MSSVSKPEPSSKIVTPGRNVWKTARAECAGVLVDAADYYLAFYEAARNAKRTILLSGWQFDSGVPLLRGADAPANADVRLLKFLNRLCEQNSQLEIYILAWDFHVVFALEREWMQSLYFQWATNERLHFRFDGAQAAQGSHHQKFAVIDRALSFLGGIDLCESRWDDRRHRSENPLRTSHGKPAKPYHDTQAYFSGCDVADVLRELFVDRWARSEGNPLELAKCEPPAGGSYEPRGAFPIGADGEIAFSRTDPRGPGNTIREVETLFVDAIASAERLIYIETQYFSSRAIRAALVARMRDRKRPRLEIVVVLNQKPEAVKEEIAIGFRQAKTLGRIARVAAEAGHALGIYDTLSDGAGDGDERPSTYIHSKLLVVDDRFLTVGSANLTNRSMGVDTELHASWETGADAKGEGPITQGITKLRVSLLAEHAGLLSEGDSFRGADLTRVEGLVKRLDALTKINDGRLKVHVIASKREKQVEAIVDPDALPFDPAHPTYQDAGGADAENEDENEDENADEDACADEETQARPLFARGLTALWEKLRAR